MFKILGVLLLSFSASIALALEWGIGPIAFSYEANGNACLEFSQQLRNIGEIGSKGILTLAHFKAGSDEYKDSNGATLESSNAITFSDGAVIRFDVTGLTKFKTLQLTSEEDCESAAVTIAVNDAKSDIENDVTRVSTVSNPDDEAKWQLEIASDELTSPIQFLESHVFCDPLPDLTNCNAHLRKLLNAAVQSDVQEVIISLKKEVIPLLLKAEESH